VLFVCVFLFVFVCVCARYMLLEDIQCGTYSNKNNAQIY